MNQYMPPLATHVGQAPVGQLPPLLPGFAGQLASALTAGNLSPTIVTAELLAFVSLLTQSTANVQWPNGQVGSIGANVYLRAPSGSGKTLIRRQLMTPITIALSQLKRENPEASKQPAFLVEDVSRTALVEHMAEWPSAGLFTDEAGQCKRLVSEGAPTLAKLMDGDTIHHARATTGRVTVADPRFTALWMEQPGIDGVGRQLLESSAAGVGIINRMYVANVPKGRHQAPELANTVPLEIQSQYASKVLVLLRQSIHQTVSDSERPSLTLSHDAQSYLAHIRNDMPNVERLFPASPGLEAYVARHVERTLRLAAALHVFEVEGEGLVDTWALQAADAVGRWSISEFATMSYVPPKLSVVEADANKLWQGLLQLWAGTGKATFLLREVRDQAVNLGLTKQRFDRALAALCEQSRAYVSSQAGSNQMLLSILVPAADRLYGHSQNQAQHYPA